MTLRQLQARHRRRRHRARHLGRARPLDERHRPQGHRGALRHRRSRWRPTPAIKGAVITSGKDTFCAGADLTMLEMFSRQFADMVEGARRGGRQCNALRGEPQAVAALPAARDQRQAVGRRDQRHGARRRLRALPRLPPPHRRRQCRRRASACRRSRSGCSPAPAAPSAWRACCRPATRCSSCSRAISSGSRRPRA